MTKPPQQTVRTVAVIDIGTNSTKLLIAAAARDAASLVTTAFQQETNRIGEGLEDSGRISNNAQVRTINTLERFRQVINQYNCDGVYAFSTHALRKADNAANVVERIAQETGITIRTLTGEEEAHYAYLAACTLGAGGSKHVYLIDVGGGSTEFVHAEKGRVVQTISLPLGALSLTERYVKSDPVSAEDLASLRARAKKVVEELFNTRLDTKVPPGQVDLVASGGSVTTISDMLKEGGLGPPAEARGGAPTGIGIKIGDIRRLEKLCLSLPLEKRKSLPGLDPARADIIPAGFVIALTFMEASGKRVLRINAGGVREGVARHIIQNNLQW